MKYVHDGKNYLLFSTYEGLGHADIFMFTESFVPKHAGFVAFKNDQQTKEALVYGESTGLRLPSEPFDYDEVNFVGISTSGYTMISNSAQLLVDLQCVDIEPAVWKESREGNYGECPVIYPAHSSKLMKACTLLKS